FAETLLPGWSAENVQAVEQLLPLIALVVLLEVPSWPFDNLMLASDRQVDAAWFQILTSLTRFFGLLGPLWLGYGLVVGMWGLVAYAVTRFVGAFWWTLRVLPPKTEPLPAGFAKEQVRFSVPLGLSSVVGRFNRQVDKIVVSVLLTATALAEYNVGAQEIPLVTVVPAAVASVLISKYVQLERSQERKALIGLWYRGIEKTTLLVVPATVGFIAVAQDFLPTLFGAGYEAAIVPFQIYSLIVLHRVTQYGSILQAFGDTKGILHLTLALLSLNLALSVPLTLWLGLPGAALSTFIANMMSWYLALRKIGRHLDLPAHRVLPFPFYLRVLSVATAVGALVWGTRTYAWSAGLPGIDLAWTAGLYLLLFALAGSTVRIIRSEDWAALRRWLSMRMLRRPTQ
ncbi:MAG: oligosaccharide flippase family protein, partial [Bacteroidota bacterium]